MAIAKLKKPEILIQKKLSNVLVLFSTRKIDFGPLTTELVAKVLAEDKEIKNKIEKTLGIKYDEVRYWERQQPPDTSDIELYHKGKKVLGISLKTTTTKNLAKPISNLVKTLRPDEIGALAFPARIRKNNIEDIIIAMAIFTEQIYISIGIRGILSQITNELTEKKIREKLDEVSLIELGQAGTLTALRLGYEAKEIAMDAKEAAKRAEKEAGEAKEAAKRAEKEAGEAKKIAMENREILLEIAKNVDEVLKTLKRRKRSNPRHKTDNQQI